MKRVRTGFGIVAIGVAFLAPAVGGRGADAAVVCRKKKSGAVVIRDAQCKKRETPVDLASFGAAGPQGPVGAPGPSTTDANDLYVGSDEDRNEAGSTLALGTDGTPRLTVLENGRVGIGTATPATTLAVAGTCSQDLAGDGLVKAWARINADGSIVACYNCNTNPSETRRTDLGQYEIDFSPLGDDITGRPRAAAMDVAGSPTVSGMVSVSSRTGDPSSVSVVTLASNGSAADRAFVLLVY